MMRIKEQCLLGIEGSGAPLSIALSKQGQVAALSWEDFGSKGSVRMMAMISQLFEPLQWDKKDLQGVCVAQGPGSFTSMRIALATAQALGLGLGIPVYSTDNLWLLASQASFWPGDVKPIINAYKGEYYTQTFRSNSKEFSRLDKMQLITPDEFYKTMKPGDLILGPALEDFMQKGFDLEAKQVKLMPHVRADAGNLLEACFDFEVAAPGGKPLEPLYIRLSDAEINYEARFGGKL